MIGNEQLQWETPEELGSYNDSIHAEDNAFDQSKSAKKHAKKLIEYEKLLEVEESLWISILQAVDEPFVEAPKEECTEYNGQAPHDILLHLQTKISKDLNRDKLNLKR